MPARFSLASGTQWNFRRFTADLSIMPSGRRRGWREDERACARLNQQRSLTMTLGTILVIILILILIGAIPNWGYSRGWGYGPSGIVGVVLVVVLILLLMGRL
jgi:hypothetical protein